MQYMSCEHVISERPMCKHGITSFCITSAVLQSAVNVVFTLFVFTSVRVGVKNDRQYVKD